MPHATRKKSMLKRYGLKGVNKPKKTPSHKTKSHVVLAQKGHKLKLIRFGQQGVSGAGSKPKLLNKKHEENRSKHVIKKTLRKVFLVERIGRTKLNGKQKGIQ